MNSNWVRIPKLGPIHYWGRYDTAHHNETRYKLNFKSTTFKRGMLIVMLVLAIPYFKGDQIQFAPPPNLGKTMMTIISLTDISPCMWSTKEILASSPSTATLTSFITESSAVFYFQLEICSSDNVSNCSPFHDQSFVRSKVEEHNSTTFTIFHFFLTD